MQRSSQRAASLRKAVLLVTALVALAAPPPAGAHVRTGSVAVDYRVRVFPTRLPLTVHVYLGDRAVRLSVRPGHSVTVLGYAGEPLLRIDDAGVTILKSPTAAALRLTPRHGSGRSFVWHDARVRGLPHEIDRGRWAIPLLLLRSSVSLKILSALRKIIERPVQSANRRSRCQAVPSRIVLEFGVTRSPAFREYRVRRRGQLVDRWAWWRASAIHRPCAC